MSCTFRSIYKEDEGPRVVHAALVILSTILFLVNPFRQLSLHAPRAVARLLRAPGADAEQDLSALWTLKNLRFWKTQTPACVGKC